MINQLLKFAVVSGAVLYLRRRWKRWAACAAVILAAVHIHGEYLDYLAALPPESAEAVGAGRYVLFAFILKNAVIVAAFLIAFVPELRTSLRKRRGVAAPTDAWAEAADSDSTSEAESVRPSTVDHDDGFDFLRRRRKLADRKEQLIRSKPAR